MFANSQQKEFSSSVGSRLSKAKHDHENVAKSKAGRLQRFMCEQSCHKIVGNLRLRERATSHLKETRDRPLSLFLHDFEEDDIKKGASGESLEDHEGVTSMVVASLQKIEGGVSHLFDGHPHCHPDWGNATEDSHVEQSHGREDFRAGPVETHSSRNDPFMGCKGKKEEIDTACCSTYLHTE